MAGQPAGSAVRNGELFIGDNSGAGEVWLLRNKLSPQMNVEEGACIRAVRRVYAEVAGIPFEQAPDPRAIEPIALGAVPGHPAAAKEACRRLGEVVGDALGNALKLVDDRVHILEANGESRLTPNRFKNEIMIKIRIMTQLQLCGIDMAARPL